MQARYRSSGDGFRSGSGYRNSLRGRFSRPQPKQYPLPLPPPAAAAPLRKAEILMEAGRLAAEYLVSKGMLPPNSLDRRLPNGPVQESKGQDREPVVVVPEGRTSALARLGQNVSTDVGYGKRCRGSRSYSRGRRNVPYSRGYGSEWGSRDNGRREPWRDRGRRYHDTADKDGDEDDDRDFAPGYALVRRGVFDEARSSNSKGEAMGESGPEGDTHGMVDDTGSKASSSSISREPPPEAHLDESKDMSEVKVVKASSPEIGDEAKSDVSDDMQKKDLQLEDIEVQPCAVEDVTKKRCGDLLKFCSFAGVPKRLRSSITQRSPKTDQGKAGETSNTLEATPAEASDVTAGESITKRSMDNLRANQDSTLECQAPEVSNIIPEQHTGESLHPQLESGGSFLATRDSGEIIDVDDEDSYPQHIDKMEDIEIQRDPPPPKVSEEIEHSLQNSEAEQSNSYIQKCSTDEEMAEAVDLQKPMDIDEAMFPIAGPKSRVEVEEGEPLLQPSFNLNLMGNPEIPDDPVFDDIQTSAPVLQHEEELPMVVGLSIGNNNGMDNNTQVSGDDKAVPVINLEDDSPLEDNVCSSLKLKNEIMYPNLDNFLSQTEHVGLAGIQDGYSLGFPDFLGVDISGCSPVSADLTNLQATISLHDAEGVPGVEDSIYGSFGEIPISFMEVWDQPPQEYEKFF